MSQTLANIIVAVRVAKHFFINTQTKDYLIFRNKYLVNIWEKSKVVSEVYIDYLFFKVLIGNPCVVGFNSKFMSSQRQNKL